MAQNAFTVTMPDPTPPTNFSFTGVTGPNPPNYTKNTMGDSKNWGPGSGTTYTPTFPPPYYDDGTAGSLLTFAANTAALAGGTGGATAGGTDGTYPGTGTGWGTTSATVNNVGQTPASTSAAHEGAGTEVSVTAPGSVAAAPTIAVSCLGNYTNLITGGPNSQHASSLSNAGTSTLTSVTGASNVSGIGTTTLTATGTNFRRDSVIYVNGIPQNTTYVSATSLTAGSVVKRLTAGTVPCTVVTGGVSTASQNWTLT